MLRRLRWTIVLSVGIAAAWACIDATEIDLLEISGTGILFGQAYLDLNADETIDVIDMPFANATVLLSTAGTRDTVMQATTAADGAFVLDGVPLGVYDLHLDSALLGDSLVAFDTESVTVELADTTRRDLGASYPQLFLNQVRAAAPGRRVFTTGIALNARLSPFGDGTVHFQDGSFFLRATDVVPSDIQPGDSVLLLGRTALDAGQPILDEVTPLVLQSPPVFLVAQEVTVGVADAAGGGTLDAALVRIRAAEIGDTSTVNGDLHFWAHNGADSVDVVFRAFLQIAPSPSIRPDTVVRIAQVTGLLVPYVDASGPRWRILPRGQADVVTEVKAANIAVTTSFDTTSASAGDTVEIRVTARNLGPVPFTHTAATGVRVLDTIPSALTFVSATQTQGSYDDGIALWNVGTLAPGEIDTLRILARVTGAPGPSVNRARSQGLQLQVEPISFDDLAVDTLIIS